MMVTDDEIKELLAKVKENAKIELAKFKVDEVILKNRTLGGQIQYYRKLNNMTQEDLASRVSLSRDAIIKYENNNVNKQLNMQTMKNYYSIFKALKMENSIELTGYEKFILQDQSCALKNIIAILGITQKSFAKIVDKPYTTVKEWMQDRVNMSKNTFEHIENILNENGYSLVNLE